MTEDRFHPGRGCHGHGTARFDERETVAEAMPSIERRQVDSLVVYTRNEDDELGAVAIGDTAHGGI